MPRFLNPGAELNPGTGKGILEFSSTTNKLIITATRGNKTTGTAGNNFREVNVTGGEVELLPLVRVFIKTLNVKAGKLTAKRSTITVTPVINIGSNAGGAVDSLTGKVAGQVKGTLVLDATAGNINLL